MEDEQRAVELLKQLVQGEPDLYLGDPVDVGVLLLYLRWTDLSVDKAFEKMKFLYKLKAQHPDWFAHRRVAGVHDVILRWGAHVLLQQRDPQGRRIYIVKAERLETSKGLHEMTQVDDMWVTTALDEEDTQKHGLHLLIDLGCFPWKLLRHLTPRSVKILIAKMENIPVKTLFVHMINAGPITNTIIELGRSFAGAQFKEQVHVHRSLDSLHELLPRAVLPVEYGGELPSPDHERLVHDILDARADRLTEIMSYGYSTTGK